MIHTKNQAWDWASYKGHLTHLFPIDKSHVQSMCGRAYSGDEGVRSTKRRHCRYCANLKIVLTIENSGTS